MSISRPSMARQLRRRAGTPKKNSIASTAPAPAPNRPLPPTGLRSSDVVAGVVATESEAVPEVAVALSAMVPLDEQVGRLEAPVGEPVSEQLSDTVPA